MLTGSTPSCSNLSAALGILPRFAPPLPLPAVLPLPRPLPRPFVGAGAFFALAGLPMILIDDLIENSSKSMFRSKSAA